MTNKHTQLANTLFSISTSSPQVIAARMMKFYTPGAAFSKGNQTEMVGMVMEKQIAMFESGMAMWLGAAQQYQSAVFKFWSAFAGGNYWAAWSKPAITSSQSAAFVNQALKPYQRKAASNARRLRKRV